MNINRREKNILVLAGVIAVVFLITSVLPEANNLYQRRKGAIDDINLAIERERRLFDETITWRNNKTEVESRLSELEAQVFDGDTIPVVEANIQRALTQYARDSSIVVSSTRLADRKEAQGWILISQEMSFRTTDSANTILFLQKLDDSTPRLWVKDFSLDRTRNQYSGSITVVGFARSEGLLSVASQTR